MKIRTFQDVCLAFVVALLLMASLLMTAVPVVADDAPNTWRYDVEIDRSGVPGWVDCRDVTLVLPVVGADRVYAWGDGAALPISHDADAQVAHVTTGADAVTFVIQGSQVTAESFGPVSLATLRDDKTWAFSLTFDDGHHTVATHAWPELDHYGYDAGVAVIGLWMEPDADPNANGFCSRDEIVDLYADGWGIYNHSYHHWEAGSNINVEDAEQCQQIVSDTLGMRPIVFTAPFTDERWQAVIDDNVESLGLRVLQLYAENGERLMTVDDPLVPSQDAAFHMARKDIKLWQSDVYNYFDQAHELAPEHAWVSLHGHNVAYDQDWASVSDALSYLYLSYGAAGSDEVWVAPVDDVIDYVVTRSTCWLRIQGVESVDPSQVVGEPWAAMQRIVLQQGTPGQEAWEDTTIHSWYPTLNYGDDAVLTLRGGTEGSALLLRPPLPELSDVTIERATLTLHARSTSNEGDMDLSIAPMTTTWDVETAAWLQAAEGQAWTVKGAAEDHDPNPMDVVHTGATELDMRSYSFDITDQMARWLVDPASYQGMIVRADDTVSKQLLFASADEIMYPAQRPMLAIEYHPQDTVSQLLEPTPNQSVCVRLPLIVR